MRVVAGEVGSILLSYASGSVNVHTDFDRQDWELAVYYFHETGPLRETWGGSC